MDYFFYNTDANSLSRDRRFPVLIEHEYRIKVKWFLDLSENPITSEAELPPEARCRRT